MVWSSIHVARPTSSFCVRGATFASFSCAFTRTPYDRPLRPDKRIRDGERKTCLVNLRRRGRRRRRREGEGEEGAEAVVVGSGVRGDEEAAGESGEGLEHGVQRV
jgi:hypothetical protein